MKEELALINEKKKKVEKLRKKNKLFLTLLEANKREKNDLSLPNKHQKSLLNDTRVYISLFIYRIISKMLLKVFMRKSK